MGKVNVKICMGTMCYVMGGAELCSVADALPDNIAQDVAVSYSPCLGMCDKIGEPPYVEINGKVIGGVGKAALLQIINDEVSNAVR
jgi:NADH:ubiquinone oxidoreductase subunit E